MVEKVQMISRRGFVASLGGLVAVSALPSFADDSAAFPKRGNFERLVLDYVHIKAGATKPFSVLHISDTHFTEAYPDEDAKKQELKLKRTQTFGGRQEEALRDSLAWAKQNVDYVIHTGDLIDWQSRANFDLVRRYFGEAAGSMCGSLGNHEYSRYMWLEKAENSEAYKAKSRVEVAAAYPFDIELQSSVVNGVNFVTIDDVYGYVTARQVERFHAEVKKGLPIVLCMHVPFYTDAIWLANSKFWKANHKFMSAAVPDARGDYLKQRTDVVTRDFIAYLKKEPLLKGILAGHLHITVQDRFSPTAMQYIVGGNFMFHGQEVLFS